MLAKTRNSLPGWSSIIRRLSKPSRTGRTVLLGLYHPVPLPGKTGPRRSAALGKIPPHPKTVADGKRRPNEWKSSKTPANSAARAVTSAKSLLAVSLARLLKALQLQLDLYRQQIEALFKQHPDHDLFGSLPGAAQALAPRLLGEIGGNPNRFEDTETLQCVAERLRSVSNPAKFTGSASATSATRFCVTPSLSGPMLPAGISLGRGFTTDKNAPKAKVHACALRCLGQRLLQNRWEDNPNPPALRRRSARPQPEAAWFLGIGPHATRRQGR